MIPGISRWALAHGLWRKPDANACQLIQRVQFSRIMKCGFGMRTCE